MKKIILIFTLVFTFLGSFLFFTNFVSAQEDYGLSSIAGKADLKKTGDLPTLSGQVLGAVLSLVGIVFFLLMIYGGILWMTARGNAQQADKSLSIIIAAVVGLIIVLGSYTLTQFLFTSVPGSSGVTSTGICSISTTNAGCQGFGETCSAKTTSDDCVQVRCCEWN